MDESLIYDTAIAVRPEYEADILRHTKTWAEIDLGALRRNYRRINAHIKEKSPLCEAMCILKADAYGHGAVMCARALYDEGVRFFGVSCITEAIQLRSALGQKNDAKILILGYTLPGDVDLLCKYGIRQTVFSREYADSILYELRRLRVMGKLPFDAKLQIHIKVNTGMNRLGFCKDDMDGVLSVCKEEDFIAEGIFTHFACADDDSSDMTDEQYRFFGDVLSAIEARGVHFECRHVCNSSALLLPIDDRFEAARCGMLLYGCLDKSMPLDTEPVMKFKTTVSHVFDIRAGESISYGASFVARRDMRIATLPVGYADGLIRSMSGARVLIGKDEAPIVGRICMDQCMVDISECNGNIVPGDEAVIFGDRPLRIDSLSKIAGTIPYEILCLVGKRVTRVYRDEK